MVTLFSLQAIILVASAVIMTRSEEWLVLSGLALGSAIGGFFGLFYTAFVKSATKVPWQIMVWRGVMNILGGVGFGVIAILLEMKFWGVDAGPLVTVANGFVCAWMAVAIAKTAEPKLVRILEERGDLPVPLPPTTKTISLVEPQNEPPTTKIN